MFLMLSDRDNNSYFREEVIRPRHITFVLVRKQSASACSLLAQKNTAPASVRVSSQRLLHSLLFAPCFAKTTGTVTAENREEVRRSAEQRNARETARRWHLLAFPRCRPQQGCLPIC
jgi:hypothetical protein